MAKEKKDKPKEEEVDVIVVRDDDGNEKVKVIEGKFVEQFHNEKTETQHMKDLILYSKIVAGISITSLVISLGLLGWGLTANVVLSAEQRTRNLFAMSLFVVGFFTFVAALALDKKIRRDKEKLEKRKNAQEKKKKEAPKHHKVKKVAKKRKKKFSNNINKNNSQKNL